MSTNIPPNLAKMVLKQTGKSAIEELELWELREAVSYVVDLPLFLTKKRLEQAKRQTTRIWRVT